MYTDEALFTDMFATYIFANITPLTAVAERIVSLLNNPDTAEWRRTETGLGSFGLCLA